MPKTDDTTIEIWKPIPSFPGYEASSLGRVKSLDRYITTVDGRRRPMRGRILKPWTMKFGYPMVYCQGTSRYVHSMVLEAFRGNRPLSHQACHNDGNRRNCHLDNLRWDTIINNSQDKKKHGTWYGVGKTSLNAIQVAEVKRMLNFGISPQDIAKLFHVTRSCIGHIKAGRSWPHITP